MGAVNIALTMMVLAIFATGMYRAGDVYLETINQMQPHLQAIQKGMKFNEPD